MEYEHTSRNQSPFADEPLSLPHFDEEATLQSARPVVPLLEVKTAARSKRRLLMGGALFVAATLGALTASLIYSQRAQPQDASATATLPDSSKSASDGFVSPSGEATGSSQNANESAAPVSEFTGVNTATVGADVNSRNSVKGKQTAQGSRVRKQPDRVVSPAEILDRDDQISADEVEMRREQRREARRLRRERRVNGRPDAGLTRIREIFEGTPRP